MNDLDKVIVLTEAAPRVHNARQAGKSWKDVAASKRCNPLTLSSKQLQRIYDGPSRYRFDNLKRLAKKLA